MLRRALSLTLAFSGALLLGCGAEPDGALPEGPVARMVASAAVKNGVPPDLMLAIAAVEGGLRLPETREVHDDDLVPIAGVLELRHGRYDSLGRGAELMNTTEMELQIHLELGTEAGARVLADLGRAHRVAEDDFEAWAAAVEELSGHLYTRDRLDYRARVFSLLRHGGTARARGGEIVVVLPHPEVPIELTFAPPPLEPLGTPEYPGAIWFETPKCVSGGCKYDDFRDADVSMIGIHDTEGDWDASVATLQNDPYKSVHYIVDADGSRVGQFIPEAYTGWHVGNYYYNARMVGIEHVGVASMDDYQTAMYEKSADLVNVIASHHGLAISRDTLIAHLEVPDGVNIPQSDPPCADSPADCISSGFYGGSSHHTDPGVYWEWCQYMEIAGGECKCNDADSLWSCVHDLSMRVRCEGTVEIVHCADTCVVEPIGTDDHCTPVATGGSGGATGTTTTTTGPVGGAGNGGAGGAYVGEGGVDFTNADASADVEGSACACRAAPRNRPMPGALLVAATALAAAALRRSRSARTHPRKAATRGPATVFTGPARALRSRVVSEQRLAGEIPRTSHQGSSVRRFCPLGSQLIANG